MQPLSTESRHDRHQVWVQMSSLLAECAWHQSLGLLHTLVTRMLAPLLLGLVREPNAYVSITQNLPHWENLKNSETKLENERQPGGVAQSVRSWEERGHCSQCDNVRSRFRDVESTHHWCGHPWERAQGVSSRVEQDRLQSRVPQS